MRVVQTSSSNTGISAQRQYRTWRKDCILTHVTLFREYVQNAVDAKATEVAISVSGNSITVENDGEGMDANDFWQSLQIARSGKDPDKDVGYKGIGIYSGYAHIATKWSSKVERTACAHSYS